MLYFRYSVLKCWIRCEWMLSSSFLFQLLHTIHFCCLFIFWRFFLVVFDCYEVWATSHISVDMKRWRQRVRLLFILFYWLLSNTHTHTLFVFFRNISHNKKKCAASLILYTQPAFTILSSSRIFIAILIIFI